MVQRCRSQAEWQECLRCPAQETGQATPRGSRPGGPCDLNGAKTMGWNHAKIHGESWFAAQAKMVFLVQSNTSHRPR